MYAARCSADCMEMCLVAGPVSERASKGVCTLVRLSDVETCRDLMRLSSAFTLVPLLIATSAAVHSS